MQKGVLFRTNEQCSVWLQSQARLTLPVLLVTLAVTPPFLLQSLPPEAGLSPLDGRRGDRSPVWQVRAMLRDWSGLDAVGNLLKTCMGHFVLWIQ